jgi:hypothetical protein
MVSRGGFDLGVHGSGSTGLTGNLAGIPIPDGSNIRLREVVTFDSEALLNAFF